MGIDISCGNKMMKCGSYSSIQRIQYHLLCGIKFYIEVIFPDDEEIINYLCSLLKEKNTIQYNKLNLQKFSKLSGYSLGGFEFFFFHPMEGPIASEQIELFLDTWDIVQDYIDSSIKNEERKFICDYIFQESKSSGKPVIFY